MDVRILNESAWDRLKAVGRSTAFDLVGTALAIVSVLLVTVRARYLQAMSRISLHLARSQPPTRAHELYRRDHLPPAGDTAQSELCHLLRAGDRH